jgi:hypothetical protein
MAMLGASGSLVLEGTQKKIATAATGGILSSPRKQNGIPVDTILNSRSKDRPMDISPDKQNLDQVFSNTAYYIDFYQRDYRWTEFAIPAWPTLTI